MRSSKNKPHGKCWQHSPGFLWGASTAPHQIEGNNLNSDFWAYEGRIPGMERSGDACDSYHRYREDVCLLADAGLNAYHFGIEWARFEPLPAWSRAPRSPTTGA